MWLYFLHFALSVSALAAELLQSVLLLLLSLCGCVDDETVKNKDYKNKKRAYTDYFL